MKQLQLAVDKLTEEKRCIEEKLNANMETTSELTIGEEVVGVDNIEVKHIEKLFIRLMCFLYTTNNVLFSFALYSLLQHKFR